MIIKNIATSNRGPGEAPGKFWKSVNVQTFLTPLFGVWNFLTSPGPPPPFWDFEKLFLTPSPLFLELQNLFDPHQIFQPPLTKVFMNAP